MLKSDRERAKLLTDTTSWRQDRKCRQSLLKLFTQLYNPLNSSVTFKLLKAFKSSMTFPTISTAIGCGEHGSPELSTVVSANSSFLRYSIDNTSTDTVMWSYWQHCNEFAISRTDINSAWTKGKGPPLQLREREAQVYLWPRLPSEQLRGHWLRAWSFTLPKEWYEDLYISLRCYGPADQKEGNKRTKLQNKTVILWSIMNHVSVFCILKQIFLKLYHKFTAEHIRKSWEIFLCWILKLKGQILNDPLFVVVLTCLDRKYN